MAFDEQLATRIRQCLAHCPKIEERKMFGCIAFMVAGHAIAGVWKRSLIARVGPNDYEQALLEPHVREFDITGKPMKGWVRVGSVQIWVNHYPMRSWNKSFHGSWHFYGHVHGRLASGCDAVSAMFCSIIVRCPVTRSVTMWPVVL